MTQSLLDKFFDFNKKISKSYSEILYKNFKIPDNFGPDNAWNNYKSLLTKELEEIRSKKNPKEKICVLEIGAGKFSSLTDELKNKYDVKLTGLDISEEELRNNTLNDSCIIYDATDANYKEELKDFRQKFDLVLSKMFLEHINKPEITHKLICYCLKPNGIAVHFYPALFEPAFVFNKLVPERLTGRIIRALSSQRDAIGVFPAYYKNCRAFNNNLINFYKTCGFSLKTETVHYSTDYFSFLFPLNALYLPIFLLFSRLKCKIFASYVICSLKKDAERSAKISQKKK